MIKIPEFLAGTEEEEQLLKFKIKAETTRKQGQQQLTAIKRISDVEAFKMNLLEEFKNALLEDLPKLPKSKNKKEKNGKTLVIADLHFKGEEECLVTLSKIGEVIKSEKPEKIYLMGDVTNGQIRPGDKFAQKHSLIDETIIFSKLFNKILAESKFNGKIKYVYGNHGEVRLFGAQRQAITDSVEQVIAEMLSFNYDVEHGIEILDGDTLLRHGHLHNPKMITWDLPKGTNRVIRGHFHEFENFIHRDIEYITAPTCMTRLGEYEKQIGKHPSKTLLLLQGADIILKKC